MKQQGNDKTQNDSIMVNTVFKILVSSDGSGDSDRSLTGGGVIGRASVLLHASLYLP